MQVGGAGLLSVFDHTFGQRLGLFGKQRVEAVRQRRHEDARLAGDAGVLPEVLVSGVAVKQLHHLALDLGSHLRRERRDGRHMLDAIGRAVLDDFAAKRGGLALLGRPVFTLVRQLDLGHLGHQVMGGRCGRCVRQRSHGRELRHRLGHRL